MYKKVLSLLLVVAICFSLCVTPSFAATTVDLPFIGAYGTPIDYSTGVKVSYDISKASSYSRVLLSDNFYYTVFVQSVDSFASMVVIGVQFLRSDDTYSWLFKNTFGLASGSSFTFYKLVWADEKKESVSFNYKRDDEGSFGAELKISDFEYIPTPQHSTAKLDVVSTAPNINVTTVNNNAASGSMTLLLGIKLCNPTFLERTVWSDSGEKLATVLVGFGKKGASYTTNLVNGLTNLSPFRYDWKSGRDYILTLYAPDGIDIFGDGTALQTLDSVQVTIDGEMQPTPDIPVGDTTYSPTPPKSPATGDVNVIVNESGNITGVQQWDGNQWIIIEKIEINNNGGGSGGTDPDNPGGGTDPDNPGGGEDKPGILDWLWNGIGKILGGVVDAISKILDAVFGRLVDLIVNLLQQIADAVVRVFDLLFTVLDRVLGALTGGFTDFLKEFFYFLPPELVDGLTLTVIFGIILAIVRFFKGG